MLENGSESLLDDLLDVQLLNVLSGLHLGAFVLHLDTMICFVNYKNVCFVKVDLDHYANVSRCE